MPPSKRRWTIRCFFIGGGHCFENIVVEGSRADLESAVQFIVIYGHRDKHGEDPNVEIHRPPQQLDRIEIREIV